MSNATPSLASTRITSLLDANSFVEIGKSITARNTDFNMAETKAPSDGVITGSGVIDGNLVYVYSQDASVLNGTVGEMHAKKISALYDLAMKTGAPVIGLVDCAGLTSGSNRCTGSFWFHLSETDPGIWNDSADHSSFWYLRRWNGSCSCTDGFYLYGSKKR